MTTIGLEDMAKLAYVSAMWTAGFPATKSGYLEYLELLTNDSKND